MAAGTALSACSLYYGGSALSLASFQLVGGLLFVYFAAHLLTQVQFVWYLYCRFKKRAKTEAPPDLTVDVFITAFDESILIAARTIKAAKQIAYPHKTFLLDDSPKKKFKHLADQLQIGYLTRDNNTNFKAGNLNAAQ
jgi:cellulose synthase/poly-beta-1,6-N-acetylglucosamine synthase-like glycosyltransferase